MCRSYRGKALPAEGIAGTEAVRSAAWVADLPGASGPRGRGHASEELAAGALKANQGNSWGAYPTMGFNQLHNQL